MTTVSSDAHGISTLPASFQAPFDIPTESRVGSTRDMGSLALFLVANWFVNGETVLIDGGVRSFLIFDFDFEMEADDFVIDAPEAPVVVLNATVLRT
jgi:hypothetical protein